VSEQPPEESWDDGLADACALVEAQLADDTAGIACLLRHGNPYNSAVVLSKCLAEVLTEQKVSPDHFRMWAAQACSRS
jgi:hypothetical protein